MKFFLVVMFVFADGFIPQGMPFDTLAECEKVRTKAIAEMRQRADTPIEYVSACLRVRSSTDKEV